jgi:DNA-binding CsgD family transcriptional regulator
MSATAVDPVAVVEALYARGLRAEQWLQLALELTRPLLDRDGLGITGALYLCPDPSSFTATHVLQCEVSEPLEAVFFEGVASLPTLYVADSFLNRTCYRGAEVRGWDEISTVRSGAARGVGFDDSLQLNVIQPDGQGCWLGSPLSERGSIGEDLHFALIAIGRHLAAVHRLRQKHTDALASTGSADAVLDPGGRVVHAEGVAKEAASRAALSRAAWAMDAVRARRDPDQRRAALPDWKSLVAERWTLVEHFESDGRRFVLAMDNRPAPPSLELLSARERDVVLRALAGQDNKAIAYALSLAPSTVRVLLARAASKLKVGSRRELLAKARALGLSHGESRVRPERA